MRTINFVGQSDKTDLMLYIAKLVKAMNKKVLYIDSKTTQKCRYIVPAIKYEEEYITTFEEIDIAVGFESHEAIVSYLNENGEDFNQYDYVFIDVNSNEMCELFNVQNPNTIFVITSYDKYDMFKSIGILEKMCGQENEYMKDAKVQRIYKYSFLNTADEKYINYSFDSKEDIKYAEKNIYIPLDEGDNSIIIQNQYSEKIKLKELSKDYKKGLISILQVIMPDENINVITKTFKNVERMV